MIYLDNAASSWPKPPVVQERVADWLLKNGANPGRSNHQAAMEAGRQVQRTRQAVAGLLNCKPERIVFTLNATMALNLAIQGVVQDGDHVVTTALDHNSVLRPLHLLAETLHVELTIVTPDDQGLVAAEAVEAAIRPDTKLVAVPQVSNLTGAVLPVDDICEVAASAGAYCLVDAAQAAGVLPPPSGASFIAAPGHKGLFGPQGTGFLYVAPGLEEVMQPLIPGGTGSESHRPYQPLQMPDFLESGTPNTPGLAGLEAGIQFVRGEGVKVIHAKEMRLFHRLVEGLAGINGVTLHGPVLERLEQGMQAPVVSLNLGQTDAVEIAYLLDRRYGIASRAGQHCAPLAHQEQGTGERGSLRLSPGYFNTRAEMDTVAQALAELAQDLRR